MILLAYKMMNRDCHGNTAEADEDLSAWLILITFYNKEVLMEDSKG